VRVQTKEPLAFHPRRRWNTIDSTARLHLIPFKAVASLICVTPALEKALQVSIQQFATSTQVAIRLSLVIPTLLPQPMRFSGFFAIYQLICSDPNH